MYDPFDSHANEPVKDACWDERNLDTRRVPE